MIEQIQKKISPVFKNNSEIAAVYLFGSHATQKANDNSDIDLAILFEKRLFNYESYQRREKYFLRLTRTLGTEPDLVDMEEVNLILLFEILTDGKILIENNIDRNRQFRAQKIVECLDFQITFKQFAQSMHANAVERLKDGKNIGPL